MVKYKPYGLALKLSAWEFPDHKKIRPEDGRKKWNGDS